MNAENQGEKTLLYDNSGATAENLDLREVLAQISQIRAIRELYASQLKVVLLAQQTHVVVK